MTARTPAFRYGFALLAVGLAIGVRLLLDPIFTLPLPFAVCFPAVIAASWYGGLRPGLTAVVLGAIASDFFVLPPRHTLHLVGPDQLPGLLTYLVVGLIISVLTGSIHAARERAEKSSDAAQTAERDLRDLNLKLETLIAERNSELLKQASILDLAHDSIFIRDDQDRIIYWNEGAQRLYGWTKEEAMGQVSHILLATQFPQPLDHIRASLVASDRWNGELAHTCRDGSSVTVTSGWTRRHDTSNQQVSVIELNSDITERRKAELALQKSESRLSAIFKCCLDGIALFEAVRDQAGRLQDFRFVMFNPAAERLTGMRASGLFHQSWLEKFPNVAGGLFEQFARTVTDDTQLDVEYFSPDGDISRWYKIAAAKLDDGLVVTFSDITTRKLAEDKRKLLAARMGLATDVLHAGVFDWDVLSNHLDWDEKMYQIYGLPKNPPVSYAAWASSLLPEDLPDAEATLRSALAAKSQGSMRFRILHPNGSLRYIEAAYGTILSEAGQVDRMVGAVIDVTERHIAEERFQLVVEAAPNAMIMVNDEGLMTLVNTQVEKLFGYERGELLGQSIEMLVPHAFRSNHGDRLAGFFAEAAAKAKRAAHELHGLRRDGSEVPMEITLNPVCSAEGQFVLVSIVDIRERTKAEERSLLLAAVIEGATDYGIFMLDPEGQILTWNEGAARIKGYSEAEIVGQHYSVFYTSEDLTAGIPAHELRIAREEGKFEAEGWRVRRDGSRFWATILITAIRDGQGNLRGFSKVARDTTERRRTEERFQRVVEASPSAMIIIGADGRITLVNTQTEQLFGYDRRELLGQPIEMLVPERFRSQHPGHRDMFFSAPVARAMGAGRDLFGMRKDGSEVPIEIGLSPISTAEGQFVLASIIDITERKRFESALQAKSAEMERFTYTVSHDLKSPIITIKSYISMIEQDLAAGKLDRTRADLQRVARAADRMQMLLEEVLTLSRVGRVENTSETVAFGSLVDEALALVAGRIQQANIQVKVDENLPSVTVDSARMIEVLQNLIDNAGKFMGSQPAPQISIGSLVAGTDGGPETRFFVKDNGIGLEERHHKRIFGLFDKLNPKSEGSGAGLAIVKRIIELQGGRIWVESPEGGTGSTFWFTLKEPLVTTGREPVEKCGRPIPAGEAPPQNFSQDRH